MSGDAIQRFTSIALVATAAAACSRPHTRYARAGIAERARRIAQQVTISEPDAGSDRADTMELPLVYEQATRRAVDQWDRDPALAKALDRVRAHFGQDARAPLDVQTTELSGGRRALALTQAEGEAKPFVLVLDRTGAPLWEKQRPLAGTFTGARDLAITAGPRGGVALFWFDPTSRVAAVRMWDGEGGVFADFQLLDVEACDAIAAVAWRHRGWLVVASTGGTLRAQLLAEDGRLAFARTGLAVGAPEPSTAAPALVLDTDESFMVVQRAAAHGGAPARVFVTRYDAKGAAAWAAPVAIDAAAGADERLVVTRVAASTVRVFGPALVDVSSAGTVARRD